jgi:hypothetical protein
VWGIQGETWVGSNSKTKLVLDDATLHHQSVLTWWTLPQPQRLTSTQTNAWQVGWVLWVTPPAIASLIAAQITSTCRPLAILVLLGRFVAVFVAALAVHVGAWGLSSGSAGVC